jgi:hypothetical protein
MTSIDRARSLLADASPEMRLAVGELISEAMISDSETPPECFLRFARELIETKSETKDGRE